jgi:hypothetical protein
VEEMDALFLAGASQAVIDQRAHAIMREWQTYSEVAANGRK